MPKREKIDEDDDDPIGLLIPIAILLVILVFLQNLWLLIPIFVLLVIFISGVLEGRKIKERVYWVDTPGSKTVATTLPVDSPSVYDKKKKKDEGITCGTFIPILIIGWLFFESRSWIFLIPLFFLFVSLIQRIISNLQGRSKVRQGISHDRHMTIHEISDELDMPEERVRRHIVHEKRSGTSDIWFDPNTGQTSSEPAIKVDSSASSKIGCVYCGFALRGEDRFCPYCGAPIRAAA